MAALEPAVVPPVALNDRLAPLSDTVSPPPEDVPVGPDPVIAVLPAGTVAVARRRRLTRWRRNPWSLR